ncbi:MAG: SDR family oxidoreductase [Anaerolineaceae bacterium]|nr:SDR family oxidoreductase [Betaproteobacteria bacterium]
METILVTGATGLLGSSLVPIINQRGHTVKTHARSGDVDYHGDLSIPEVAFKLLDKIKPEAIVNLVGLTNVDRCEALPNQAYLANVRTVENIVSWIKQEKASCHLVHVSTDQVYDENGAHAEDQVTLTNYYAFSKYAGELAAAKVPSTILRTNFFGRSRCAKRVSLTDWLYHSLLNGDEIQVFDDVLFSPLSMTTLSEMIELVIRKKPVGVFNLGSYVGMSKADFAFAFAEELDFPTRTMIRTTTDKVTFLKTYRPKNMRMDSLKFENILGVKLPILRDEIRQVAREYREVI